MQVTSDTLFHFTTSFNNLKNILLKKFQLTYCHEQYLLDSEKHEEYYPMVSFCDIPLSLAKDHIKRYGSYAIGMTKEWGIKNNLNPAVYIEKNSLLAKDIQATINHMIKILEAISLNVNKNFSSTKKIIHKAIDKVNIYLENSIHENKSSVIKELHASMENIETNVDSIADYKKLIDKLGETANNSSNLFRYIKNYESILIRNDNTSTNYRFYDEREWRYVPALNDDRVKKYLNAEQFKKYRGTSKNKPFIENINLPFTSDDIKYLIVESNKDIPKLIKVIKNTNSLTKNSNEKDILTTKILTLEQLNEDF
jgi:hypothetical protein